MKKSIFRPAARALAQPVGKAFAGAARTFDEMDIFPMSVTAGAAAMTFVMLAAACCLAFATYRSEGHICSRAAYENLLLARGLFDGGLRLLTLGCASAIIADILIRSRQTLR